jgi:tetratricopeptide (TPR) repeat protein
MPSLIPGFEYDIFISYRQKDNKYDGWVTEFVKNLKGELESAFKEEISVYFDVNPLDGLLETHDVEASLKDKLKCLIFIPIISRTYCDPKSFAWEHEFKAFVEQASKDHFGLKVKLNNGNVASRVLPVLIHDLDTGDIKLCESVLGGILRGVEFIYKERGVNRSLTPADDDKKNLNNTRYRNQINKVALAAREILMGLQTETGRTLKDDTHHKMSFREYFKGESQKTQVKAVIKKRDKIQSGFLVFVMVIVASILIYHQYSKRDKLAYIRSSDSRISVAVMPFHNLTNDTILKVWQVGIQDILITSLSNSEELKVRQIESTSNLIQSKGLSDYASITPAVAGKISQKLDADVFIYGSIKRSSSTIRLNAQLTDSKTTETFKSFQIDGTADKILQIIDSLSLMVKNYLIISKLGKDVTPDYKHLASTNHPEAYRYFFYGKNAFMKGDYPTAVNMLSQAIAVDSNFTFATIMVSFAYGNLGLYDQAKKSCLKIYERRDQMPIQQKIYTNWAYAAFFGTPDEEIKYIRQFLEIDDQQPLFYYVLGESYNKLYQYDKAVHEYEHALEIYGKWGTKPMWIQNYTKLGFAYHKTGQYGKEKELYKKAELDFPDNQELIFRQAVLSLNEGDTISANRYIEKIITFDKIASISEADILNRLGDIYWEAAIFNKSEDYYGQALSLEPEDAYRLNRVAWVLIDNNRNINEGLRLVDKALALKPYDYNIIDTKGWALYKLGKKAEALEILEKSWNLKPTYNHGLYLHIQEVKKAIANQKKN